MTPRGLTPYPGHKADSRSSEELLDAHRLERQDPDSDWNALWELRSRAGQAELEMGLRLSISPDPADRVIGADLLAQLGPRATAFQDEVVGTLVSLLGDPESAVIEAAAIGLGHRQDARAIDALVSLAGHGDPAVRFGVAFGLNGLDDERALSALVGLSSDPDLDTRNWAMFGLGSQVDADSPEIREALAAGIDDDDSEVRGEALTGLARRGDPRALSAVARELANPGVVVVGLEAAGILADRALVPALEAIQASTSPDDDSYFCHVLAEVLEACRTGTSTEQAD